jgi:hypothetical protein
MASIRGAESEPDGLQRSNSEPCRFGVFVRYHSASRARIIARLSGFFTLFQSFDGPTGTGRSAASTRWYRRSLGSKVSLDSCQTGADG